MADQCTINVLKKFLAEVDKMERVVLMPNRLQDLEPEKTSRKDANNNQALADGLYRHFLILKNVKSELTTGHGLELGDDLNPIKDELNSFHKALNDMSALAGEITEQYKSKYELTF
ncbi:mid1-interacting protein 1-like [Nematostella vectensis]|uniref:mid1-interacting protein 1-like n=1 Tax=Nematostella vectensis TaxID=45351 RepID=UPI0020771677|nr:mid1-interacting protein 1-like [Nematostella vectensis]